MRFHKQVVKEYKQGIIFVVLFSIFWLSVAMDNQEIDDSAIAPRAEFRKLP